MTDNKYTSQHIKKMLYLKKNPTVSKKSS